MGLDIYTPARLFIEKNQFASQEKKPLSNHVSCFQTANMLTTELGGVGWGGIWREKGFPSVQTLVLL